jgi:hypothetical protein
MLRLLAWHLFRECRGIGLVIAGVPLVGLWALIGMILCIIGFQLAIGWLHPKPELNTIEQK